MVGTSNQSVPEMGQALATELRQAPRGAKDATTTRGASFVFLEAGSMDIEHRVKVNWGFKSTKMGY